MNAPTTTAQLAAADAHPHTNAAWHARRLAATPRGVGVMGDFFIDRAKNAEFGTSRAAASSTLPGALRCSTPGMCTPRCRPSGP